MASRAHDLVLRAVPARPASCRLSGVRRDVRLSCSTPITSPPVRATRGRGAGLLTRPDCARSRRLSRACRCGGRAADRVGAGRRTAARGGAHPGDRPQSRAAAPGADCSPTSCTPSRRTRSRPATTPTGARRVRTRSRAALCADPVRRPHHRLCGRAATASTTRARRIRCSSGRCASRAISSPTRNGSNSSPTAATRRRRCGSPTAGRRPMRKAGTRPATGARSTAPGTR